MDRRRFLSTVGAGSFTGIAGCAGLLNRQDPADVGRPRLSVDGQWLTDPEGTRVVLRGVTTVDPWWGTTHANRRGKDYWDTLKLATDSDAGWHSHVLRVPIRVHSISEVGLETLLEEYLDRVVALARDRDVYVIIAYDATERYDTTKIEEQLLSFWDRVAPRYADETHVLFDMFSTPGQPAGDDRQTWLTWRETAKPWVSQIRTHAPDTPIIVGSPGWNSLTKYAPDDPFADDNIVYAFHVNPSWDPDTWEEAFGDPAFDIPLFATEWGYVGENKDGIPAHLIGSTEEWGEPFRDWLNTHTNVNWCATTFDSMHQPRMFNEDWQLLGGDKHMGKLTKDWLAETHTENWPPGRTPDSDQPDTGNRPPSPPSEIKVTERTEHSLSFTWSESTDPDGDNIVQYRVRCNTIEVALLKGADRQITLTDLDPDGTYQLGLTAVDEHGLASTQEATVTATTQNIAEPRATIERANEPPTMDGTLDEIWSDVSAHPIETTIIQESPDTDLGGEWRALWDESALYFLVTIVDTEHANDSDAGYLSDSVEIFIDPDNSQGQSYDGDNDAQIIFERGEETAVPGYHTFDGFRSERVGVTQIKTTEGWHLAVTLPWEVLQTVPMVGHRFGTNIHINDDGEGGNLNRKYSWFSANGEAWKDPSTFALVELVE
ncbi:cellulase family glycosylhydrolase [Haloarcula sp. S1AR25-5A]|uniref:Cellulase family glycosylhydrolase n=1 Tax=Haloarcula terrestris TaxID=2950533 RepID=A0AAE4JL49_9EURY|nr:sugar-binding protein [Haloarcula terrestris]MDS0223716.1 cellulase family glycosylhydrolase [Haloarcula terrestris]